MPNRKIVFALCVLQMVRGFTQLPVLEPGTMLGGLLVWDNAYEHWKEAEIVSWALFHDAQYRGTSVSWTVQLFWVGDRKTTESWDTIRAQPPPKGSGFRPNGTVLPPPPDQPCHEDRPADSSFAPEFVYPPELLALGKVSPSILPRVPPVV